MGMTAAFLLLVEGNEPEDCGDWVVCSGAAAGWVTYARSAADPEVLEAPWAVVAGPMLVTFVRTVKPMGDRNTAVPHGELGIVDYRSSFGYGGYQWSKPQPELYFNVGLDRRFREPLGETLIPLALVSLLLFGAILITTADHERRAKVGFTTLATITLTMSAS